VKTTINFIVAATISVAMLPPCYSADAPANTTSAATRFIQGQTPVAIFNVAKFGAVGDGTSNSTRAIQAALDAASASGNGLVVFPQGTFMAGALYIKSNTTVQLDQGVTLKAIPAPTWWNIKSAQGSADGLDTEGKALYPQIPTRVQGVDMNWVSAFINVRHAQNVSIKGKGTIDGNGQSWWAHYYGEGTAAHAEAGVKWALNWDEQRPRALETYESSNITLQDFTIQNSAFWTVHLCYTDNVHVDGVIVNNWLTAEAPKMPSTDGIDIDSSSNLLIENTTVTANDDGFVIKSGRDGDGLRVGRPTKNVVIRNSLVQAGSAAFTIGSETSGGASNIEVYNIQVKPRTALVNSNIGTKAGGPAVYSAFIFKSAPTRGGIMENVYVHDIKIDDAYYFMRAEQNWTAGGSIPADFGTRYALPPYWNPILVMPQPASLGYPIFRNFQFKNISMANVETQVFEVSGSTLSGEAEKGRFTHFSFDKLRINAMSTSGTDKSAGTIANAGNWAFTDSAILDAHGAAIAPAKDTTTTNNLSGLGGW
jgi:polygalacturonase